MDKVLAALGDLLVGWERGFAHGERESATGEREESVQKISAILEEAEINSTSRFTDLLLEILEHERLNRPLKAGVLDPLEIGRSRDDAPLRHRVPEVPFHHNGDLMDPGDVERFDGSPLHWAIVGEGEDARLVACDYFDEIVRLAQRQSAINLVKSEATRRQGPADRTGRGHEAGGPHGGEYEGTVFGPADGDSGSRALTNFPPFTLRPGGSSYVTCPANPPRPPKGAQFFEHDNFGGHWFWLDPGFTWPDLRQVDMGGWFGTDWNDKISSLKTGDGFVVLCEHINLGGSTLTFFGAVPTFQSNPGPGHPICGPGGFWKTTGRQEAASLHSFGWNDRTSSIRHII